MSNVVGDEVVGFHVVDEHIAVFTLNRPKAMNAVNHSVSTRMEKLMKDFEDNDALWVGVLCSSHKKVFSAGADLKAISKNEVSAHISHHIGVFLNRKSSRKNISHMHACVHTIGSDVSKIIQLLLFVSYLSHQRI
jgi:enoyl-CoA hydratase/carnithine racemase